MENCALEIIWHRNRSIELKKLSSFVLRRTAAASVGVSTHKYLRIKVRVLAFAPTNTRATLHKES